MLRGFANRVLGACTALLLGPQVSVDPRVRALEARVAGCEDALERERIERKQIVAEVEAMLDTVTRRYSKARAAESRANGENGARTITPEDLLTSDPAAYDRWVLAGKPPLGG